jgi:antitoxin VapB
MIDPDADAARLARREQIARLAERLGLGAILLRRPANFAWYTGGADNRVDRTAALGVADVVVTRDRELVFTSAIEAPRMREEQTPGIEVVAYPWFEDFLPHLRRVVGDAPLGADFAHPGVADCADEIAPLRYVLDAEAIARYRRLGADAARALDEAAGTLAPGMSEHEAAAAVAAACLRAGLACPVILAAADERIARHRHPIAGAGIARRRLMLVACPERGGLVANLTRFVDFAPPDDEQRRRQDTCDTILRRMREEATRPGRTLAEAFADCARYYAEAGYPDEWRLHHQGGLTGYASREVIATPATRLTLQVGHAFAWNPSITGAKAEETFVLTEAGAEVIVGMQPAYSRGGDGGDAGLGRGLS